MGSELEVGEVTMVPIIKRKSLLVLLLLALYACASLPRETDRISWSCDPQGDNAVNSGNWEEAFLRHQELLAAHPDNCLAMYHLGYIWGRMGDREKEIDHYNQAVACGYDSDDLLYFNLGMAYGEIDQMENAIAAFQRAVALNPRHAENQFGLGLTARSAGHAELARQALARAVEIDPRHWDARIELARVDLDQGRLKEARAQLDAVQEGAPDHAELQALWRIYEDRKITIFDPEDK
jgi:tetratricopeptide (TPR) repeat protein